MPFETLRYLLRTVKINHITSVYTDITTIEIVNTPIFNNFLCLITWSVPSEFLTPRELRRGVESLDIGVIYCGKTYQDLTGLCRAYTHGVSYDAYTPLIQLSGASYGSVI